MSGLKNIAATLWNEIQNIWDGEENRVGEQQIIDTASYLEEMGYDLYGYGFVTEKKPITKAEDETKTLTYDQDSEVYKYLTSYLISDNYAYIIKNTNKNFTQAFSGVTTFFKGLINSSGWGSGLISIYLQAGNSSSITGKPGDAYGFSGIHELAGGLLYVTPIGPFMIAKDWNELTSSIKVDRDAKKLVIVGPGIFNNTKMEYSLDGWVGRYSMPLEFLLATHIATMAPDLSFKMATTFNTDVQIILYPSNDAAINAGIRVDGDDNKITTKDEMDEENSWWGPNVSKKEAYEIFKNSNGKIHSLYDENDESIPDNFRCIGVNSVEVGNNFWGESTNAVNVEERNGITYDFKRTKLSQGTEEVIDEFVCMRTDESERYFKTEDIVYLFTEYKDTLIGGIKDAIKDYKDIEDQDTVCEEAYNSIINVVNSETTFKWDTEKNINIPIESQTDASLELDFSYKIVGSTYDAKGDKLVKCGESSSTLDSSTSYKVFENYKIKITGVKLYMVVDGNTEIQEGDQITESSGIPCSNIGTEDGQNNLGIVCSHCQNYLNSVNDVLRKIDKKDFKTYVPYINKVSNHWYRNVYFTANAIKDDGYENKIIQTDEIYEKETAERWTLYETYSGVEGKVEQSSDYKLYIYVPDENGNYTTEFLENGTVLCKELKTKEESTKYVYKYKLDNDNVTYIPDPEGMFVLVYDEDDYTKEYSSSINEFRVGKKAKTKNIDSGWSAYKSTPKQSDLTWKLIQAEAGSKLENEVNTLNAINGVEMVYQANYKEVEQAEDGVRGETNPEIKKLFLDDYYLYDGSEERAGLIATAKKMVKNQNSHLDSDDPDSFKELFGENKEISYESENLSNSIKSTISEISGPISLSHSALNAFSMLENMHTLDAEFIYHDFKELIVELDYFDKEDLVEAEEDVMMFPIDSASGEWPVARYDKTEEYGTLIHSEEDYDALKAETIEEIMKLLSEEEKEEFENNQTTTTVTTPTTTTSDTVTSNNPLVLAAKDVADMLINNDGKYCMGGREKSKSSGNNTHTQCHRAISLSQLQSDPKTDCSGFVSICLQQVGILADGTAVNSQGFKGVLNDSEIIDKPSESQLEPGMICVYSGHVNIYAGEYDGVKKFYDWGGKRNDLPMRYFTNTINYAIKIAPSKMVYNGIAGIDSSTSAVSSGPYTGYTNEENNKVISPASGRILKYGTIRRKNTEADKGAENYVDQPAEVGFIKIELANLPMTNINDCDDSAYKNSTEDPKKWFESYSDESTRKRLGFEYFTKEYSDAGISNCVIYIDGFKPLVKDDGTKVKNADELAEYIEAHESDCSYNANQNVISNLLDDSREFQLKVAEAAKELAPYIYRADDGKIYIKEGAIIGNTYKNTEAPENMLFEKTVSVKATEEDVTKGLATAVGDLIEKKLKVGNYLRLIFRDENDEIIENVEEYVKIDSGNGGSKLAFNKLNVEASEEELEMLAAVLVAEHGTSATAMASVANVIKNRANDTVHYNNVTTIADVLTATGQYGCVFPVGDNPEGKKGGYGTPPNGNYSKIYDLKEGYGKFVVGNQNGRGFTERSATEESKGIVQGVLSGSIEDVASSKLGKLALYQVTLRSFPNHLGEPHCYVDGELFSHLWGPLRGNLQTCDCTLSH